jgi:hypothetical protein
MSLTLAISFRKNIMIIYSMANDNVADILAGKSFGFCINAVTKSVTKTR